jgi:hypothetical protein
MERLGARCLSPSLPYLGQHSGPSVLGRGLGPFSLGHSSADSETHNAPSEIMLGSAALKVAMASRPHAPVHLRFRAGTKVLLILEKPRNA